jgi:hypothetical protein
MIDICSHESTERQKSSNSIPSSVFKKETKTKTLGKGLETKSKTYGKDFETKAKTFDKGLESRPRPRP